LGGEPGGEASKIDELAIPALDEEGRDGERAKSRSASCPGASSTREARVNAASL
jgi:hypothetical protein